MSDLIAFVIKTLLGVVALGIVFGVAAIAFGGGKVSTTATNLSTLVLNVQSNYGAQGNFSSLTNAIMVRLAPSSMVANSGMSNSWGGVVTGGVDPANAAQFFVEQNNVPADACPKLATFSGALSVQINGGSVYNQQNRIDASEAITQCNAANDANTIRLIFGRV